MHRIFANVQVEIALQTGGNGDKKKLSKRHVIFPHPVDRPSTSSKFITFRTAFASFRTPGYTSANLSQILLEYSNLAIVGVAVCAALALLAACPNGSSQVFQNRHGRIPVYASVCDADSLLETRRALGRNLLIALVDVGLDHDTNDGILSLAKLVSNHLGNLGLVTVVLVRVA